MLKLALLTFFLIFSTWGNTRPGVYKKTEIVPQKHLPKAHAEKWFRFYTKRGKKALERHLRRGDHVRKTVEVILMSHQVPIELYYVGLIESGYQARVKSHAGAKGPWQFMPATAKRYGLKVDNWVDERHNIYKATHAAARYFKDLYNFFSSWTLAIAAYNAGEYRIIDAIRKAGTRDFRKLSMGGYLPIETRNYLAKIWVVSQLDQQRARFGLEKSQTVLDSELLDSVQISHSMSISEIKRLTGISSENIRHWNPDILGPTLKASKQSPFEVFLPPQLVKKLKQPLEQFRLSQVKNPKVLNGLGLKRTRRGDLIRLSKLADGQVYIKDLSSGDFIIIDQNIIKI